MITIIDILEVVTDCHALTTKTLNVVAPSSFVVFINGLIQITLHDEYVEVHPNRYVTYSVCMDDIFDFQEWMIDFFSAY
ncbi:hypothetical protein RsoM2USA_285 [Ralstonia phage RsoM2USA]|nr:hypothetical protein RsoM2USA_285 [Ralstonia phage RsoM2USA]